MNKIGQKTLIICRALGLEVCRKGIDDMDSAFDEIIDVMKKMPIRLIR